jgi:hypothetical protein
VITAPDSSRSDSTQFGADCVEMLTLLANDWSVAVSGVRLVSLVRLISPCVDCSIIG